MAGAGEVGDRHFADHGAVAGAVFGVRPRAGGCSRCRPALMKFRVSLVVVEGRLGRRTDRLDRRQMPHVDRGLGRPDLGIDPLQDGDIELLLVAEVIDHALP
jgi:hypothetical protein